MARILQRPSTDDTCRCPEPRTFVFVQKLGIFIHEDGRCRLPTRAYRDAAYEAGIIGREAVADQAGGSRRQDQMPAVPHNPRRGRGTASATAS